MCGDHPPHDESPRDALRTRPGMVAGERVGRRTLLAGIAGLGVPRSSRRAAGIPLTRAGAARATKDRGAALRSRSCRTDAAGTDPIGSGESIAALLARYGVHVHPRAEWAGKLAAKGPLETETPRFLLVHHTLSSNAYTRGAVAEQLRSFYGFHTGPDKGWNDVAYNFFVDRFGEVWEGRSGSLAGPVRGDATGGNQGYSQLVCMIGDYGATPPGAVAAEALARVLAALGTKYGIDTSPGATTSFVSRKSNRWKAGACVQTPTIAGHREMSYTECPGDALFGLVRGELPARVSALRATA